MNGIADADMTKQESRIYVSKNGVESAISSLEEFVARVHERLKPVINERPPPLEKEPSPDLKMKNSSAVDWLENQEERILRINGRLSTILDTIEL